MIFAKKTNKNDVRFSYEKQRFLTILIGLKYENLRKACEKQRFLKKNAAVAEKKQCFRMPRDGRTGAGMPELRRGEIKQSILLSKSLHFESKRCSCEGVP